VIPLAMTVAVLALQQAGFTLNLMSVGGLAVAVGLIIDDAIVVIENIERNAREHTGETYDEIIVRAMSQISGAMAISTATTVVVFIPLALLGGVTGFFFRALAFTLAASLIVSLGLALLVAPIVARSLNLRAGNGPGHGEGKRDLVSRLLERYEPVLRWTLGHRSWMYAGAALVLVLTVALLARLPSDFLPKMDEGQFEIAYTLPAGTTLAASDAAATSMAALVAADPSVASVGRLSAVDSNGYSPTQTNQGLLRVRLKPRAQRQGYDEVSTRLRSALGEAVPAALFDFHQILEDLINDLSGTPAPVTVVLRGVDQQQLIALANEVKKRIAAVPGVVDASSGVVYDSPSLRIAPQGVRMAALGVDANEVGSAVAALTQGSIATNVAGRGNMLPVRVSIAGANSADLASTSLLAKGTTAALGDLSSIRTVRLQSEINAVNGQTVVRVTANIQGAHLSAVTAGLRKVLASISFPPGYSAQIGGAAAVQQRSFAEFASVVVVAVGLVFAVMLAAFQSYRLPLVVLTAIPLALIGVALGLFLTGTPFNVSSFMGLLLLVGVVVKNGILLIDVANKRMRAGDTVENALVVAGRTRLRPIVMTTLAAIGGLVPLALGLGQGAEMERPLAIAVIGGLSTATIFTLLVIPTLYATFLGRRPPASLVGNE
jgi:multidrug efflux pump subunit AcrB